MLRVVRAVGAGGGLSVRVAVVDGKDVAVGAVASGQAAAGVAAGAAGAGAVTPVLPLPPVGDGKNGGHGGNGAFSELETGQGGTVYGQSIGYYAPSQG